MDKQTAKEILSTYRQNSEDASDENFREALDLCQRDPEMREWLDGQTTFDGNLASALDAIRPPSGSKAALLATLSFETETSDEGRVSKRPFHWWRLTMAAAALVAVSLVSFQLVERKPKSQPAIQVADASVFGIATQLANQALPLQKMSQDLPELQNWLTSQGAPVTASLQSRIGQNAIPAGCRVFELEDGRKVSLMCYQSDGQLVHVFTMDRSSLEDETFPERAWQTRDSWQLYAWSEGASITTVASQLPIETLEELVGGA